MKPKTQRVLSVRVEHEPDRFSPTRLEVVYARLQPTESRVVRRDRNGRIEDYRPPSRKAGGERR